MMLWHSDKALLQQAVATALWQRRNSAPAAVKVVTANYDDWVAHGVV
jgi:hypothetical protein